jgi:hypothetical protein
MTNQSPSPNEFSSLRVTIDNQPVDLPNWLSDSLASIKTYLECLAMKKERVLWTLQVDGTPVNLADTSASLPSFNDVRAGTITYGDLTSRLISAGREKVNELRAAVEESILLVLINDWSIAEGLWYEWEPQLREPVLSLQALRELLTGKCEEIFDDEPLGRCVDELELIVTEVELLFSKAESERSIADSVTFSEILEFTLLPWLARFQACYDRIEQKTDRNHLN